MKQRLLIALFTALVFGAGFAARMWTEGDAAVPPPPAAIGSEFVRGAAPPAGDGKAGQKPPASPARNDHDQAVNRAKLVSDIEKLRPQIDAYRTRLDEMDAEFERGLVALLTPEQCERYTARQKRNADGRAKRDAREAADPSPLSDEQIRHLQEMPLWNALYSVAISWRYDRLNKDMKFDDAQQEKVRELMRVRRDKFLALVDSTPPPSITLSQLATQTQKLAAPPAK